MNLYSLPTCVLFLFLVIKFTAAITISSNPTHLTRDVSINCGSLGNSASNNGREWIGDVQPKSSSLLQLKGSSTTTSTVIPNLISVDPVPHKTARISQSQFSYAFQVSPGQKIIRLHFSPTSYKGFKGRFEDLFTVEAGPFTLLGNFSASLTADALGVDSIIKEFCLNVQENQHLDIIFSPESIRSLHTYAFINGIEIFSVPENLSYFEGGDVGVQLVGEKSLFYFDHNTALEIFHRMEIKQNSVHSAGDLDDDMFPKWATRTTKKRYNSTWKMPVDVGFKYMIRVHLSESGLKIAGSGDQIIFEVLINEMIVHTNIDHLVKGRNENSIITWYRDYMVVVRGNKREGKRDILISFKSYDDLIDAHTFLSRLEIFKLSNSDNSLASPNPVPPARDSPSQTSVQTIFYFLCQRNAISIVVVAIISLVCTVVHKLQEIQEANITEEGNEPKPKPEPSTRAERICRRFSLDEIHLATNKFSDTLLIGSGGFGKVYKGHIDEEQTTVAIKRLKSSSKQGAPEFWAEIKTVPELRHVNLVPLIGYCNEGSEMILVYEYMSCGTLADHIYNARENGSTSSSSFTWKQRLDICIGVGRGLDYLHTGNGIIHRDVKTSNILLDENFTAKVSDFGLAKLENKSKLHSHVSTEVKGTRGYLDPNYYHTNKLRKESDTYAFGVVLLEVLCGRPAVDSMAAENEQLLTVWARDKINKGEVDQIVATNLKEEISPNSLKTFVRVVERCLLDEPKKRPPMSIVVLDLELAAEQQVIKQPFEIAANISDGDNHCLNNDKDGPSTVQTEQTTIVSTAVQYSTPPPDEQTNNNVGIAQLPHNDKDDPPVQTGQPLSEVDVGTSAPAISESCSTSNLCRRFSFEDIKTIIGNLNENSIIGNGRFFKVYKGFKGNATTMAIKRLKPSSGLGDREFLDKIDMASNLRHLHLVSPIGYCNEGGEMILVYDYMAHGSLLDCLHNENNNKRLKWKQRLQICIGAARGLQYLNTCNEYHNMHRMVNARNILLDKDWVAKVSVAPGYIWQKSSVEKYDVYSFGLVLFQVLFTKPEKSPNYKKWVESCRKGTLKKHISHDLYIQIASECLSKFVETALACENGKDSEKPTMSEVVRGLESAMQLQE